MPDLSLRREHAGGRTVAALDLNRRVVDFEAVLQFVAYLTQKIVGRPFGADEVDGERAFGGPHGPDVQIVDAFHAW